MNPIQERLVAFLAELNISAQKFERQCDMGQGGAAKLSNRSYATTFAKIAKAFPQLNINWLKTGEGEMLNPKSSVDVDVDVDIKVEDHGQLALRDITNIGHAKAQILILNAKIKALQDELKGKDKQLAEKDSRIEELNASLERERKMNDYLMGQ